ncbi:MAG TPA: serine/threonine protein kinase [Firmicutes bacterium]|nr:serine/threonine protein kinase [Bacillota bacterium]
MADELHSFGNYEILEKIASGGMASVFLAKRRGMHGFEKIVAIKKILEHLADNEEFLDMFINEAKLAAQLTHQNIVQIFELGKIGNSFFMVMEYVKGQDLRQIIKTSISKKINIPLLSLEIIRQVCSGLDYAHRKRDLNNVSLNVVHRDISPQNIRISYEGEIKIVDFGIAKAATQNESTRAGVLKGKVSYMSPEQAWGKVIDHRSDIFSTGIILYELITGIKCFKGETPLETLEYVREAKFTPPKEVNPKIPNEICEIIKKSLTKNPLDRYQYASEMKDDIEKFIYGSKYPKDSFDLSKFMQIVFKDDIRAEEERLSEMIKKSNQPVQTVETEKVIFSSPETTPTVPTIKKDIPPGTAKKKISIVMAKDARSGGEQSAFVTIVKGIIYFLLPFLFLWNFYPNLYHLLLNSIPIDEKAYNVLDFRVDDLPKIIIGISRASTAPVKVNPKAVQYTKIIIKDRDIEKILVNGEQAEISEKNNHTYVWGVPTNEKLKIDVFKRNHKPHSFEIFLNNVHPIKAFDLKFVPDEFLVEFKTEPEGAKIYFGSKELPDLTPFDYYIDAPERDKVYEYSFEYKDFGIYTSTFLPGDSTYFPAHHKFIREYGYFTIKVIPKGLIFLGKKQIGLSSGNFTKIKMLVGKYKIRIYNPDAEVSEYINVTIEKDKEFTREVILNVNIGWVQIISNPPNLHVFVDGKDVGLTPIPKLKLDKGVHKIVIRHDELGDRIFERVIIPNQTIIVEVDFFN